MTRPDSPGAASPVSDPPAASRPAPEPPAAAAEPAPSAPPELARPPRRPSLGRIVAACAVIAAGLHTLAVIWTWWAWSPGARGSWLVWLDLPVSLVYLDRVGSAILPWSLVAGGLQWAATGALLAWAVGRAAKRRRRP